MANLQKCNSYEDAERILGNRSKKKIGHNTWLQKTDESIEAIYHETAVVVYEKDGTIWANTGGWHTVTTKDRLNQLLPNTQVYSKSGIWYINGERFFDGVQVDCYGKVLNPLPEKDQSEVDDFNKKTTKEIKKFVANYMDELVLNGLPMPSGGDCWGCLGMIGDDKDHLFQHMEEQYFVPSLAVNALRERGYQDAGIYYFLDMQPEENRMGGRSTQYGTRVSVDTVKRALTKYMRNRLILVP